MIGSNILGWFILFLLFLKIRLLLFEEIQLNGAFSKKSINFYYTINYEFSKYFNYYINAS